MSETEEALEQPQSEQTVTAVAADPQLADATGAADQDQVSVAAVSNAAARLEDLWPEIVARWLSGCIHNSPLAQATEAYNHLLASLPALRQVITETL